MSFPVLWAASSVGASTTFLTASGSALVELADTHDGTPPAPATINLPASSLVGCGAVSLASNSRLRSVWSEISPVIPPHVADSPHSTPLAVLVSTCPVAPVSGLVIFASSAFLRSTWLSSVPSIFPHSAGFCSGRGAQSEPVFVLVSTCPVVPPGGRETGASDHSTPDAVFLSSCPSAPLGSVGCAPICASVMSCVPSKEASPILCATWSFSAASTTPLSSVS